MSLVSPIEDLEPCYAGLTDLALRVIKHHSGATAGSAIHAVLLNIRRRALSDDGHLADGISLPDQCERDFERNTFVVSTTPLALATLLLLALLCRLRR